MADEQPELLGNSVARERLLRLVTAERLHPCLLFEGPTGVGRHATARWLAQVLNCEEGLGQRCGACWSCRQVAKGSHPDVIEVGLDPNRTAPVISVEQVRELLGRIAVQPWRARRRVCILDPADALSPSAANALLHALEEPPASTGFVLISTTPSRLMVTVRSRCQRVRFGPVPTEELSTWLTARGVSDAQRTAELANGCPGRALLMDRDSVEANAEVRDGLLDALAGDVAGLFKYSEKLAKGERAVTVPRVDEVLSAIGTLARDAACVAGGSGQPLYNPDCIPVVQAWAHGLGWEGLGRLSVALDEARLGLEAYVSPRLLMDALLFELATELGPARRARRSP